MKTLAGLVSAASLATLLSPHALADMQGTFMRKAIEGNLAEIRVGELA